MPRFAQGSPSRRDFAGSAKKTAAVFASLLLLTGTAAAEPHCPGRFPNPVTDVCWSCVFPIVVGTNVPLGKVPDDSYTPDTDASALAAAAGDLACERYVLSQGKLQVELLDNLDQVAQAGAVVLVAFPRVSGATGLPARVWAITE